MRQTIALADKKQATGRKVRKRGDNKLTKIISMS
jgi:hypothetical protein